MQTMGDLVISSELHIYVNEEESVERASSKSTMPMAR